MNKLIPIIVLVILLLTACGPTQEKYEISNDSSLTVLDSEYEKLYDRSFNAAFAYIDIIDEEDYLSAENGYLKVYGDNSAVFLVRTVEKEGIKDNSVMVTFSYVEDEKNWKRDTIVYDNIEYGAK